MTKPVTLQAGLNGTGPDPYGGTRVGFGATTEVSRKELGLEWNALLKGGGAVVGDKATVTFEIEAVKTTGRAPKAPSAGRNARQSRPRRDHAFGGPRRAEPPECLLLG